jgi:hypothetical protein
VQRKVVNRHVEMMSNVPRESPFETQPHTIACGSVAGLVWFTLRTLFVQAYPGWVIILAQTNVKITRVIVKTRVGEDWKLRNCSRGKGPMRARLLKLLDSVLIKEKLTRLLFSSQYYASAKEMG